MTEIYNYDKSYFIGCSRVRLIVDHLKLKKDDYIFVNEKQSLRKNCLEYIYWQRQPNWALSSLFI